MVNKESNKWTIKNLEEVCAKATKIKASDCKESETFKYIDIGSIDNTTFKLKSHKEYTWKNAPSRAKQIIKKNDVLFSTVRTYLKNIAYVDKNDYDDQICSTGFTVIRAKEAVIDSKFLFYFVISDSFLDPLNKLQTGSSYPAVRDKDVFSQPVPTPPLPEQHRIVAKIEELFSELDNGIANLKQAKEQLRVYRQSVLKRAFEGRFIEVKKYNIQTLGTLADIRGGVTKGRKLDGKETVRLPYLRVANVQDGFLNLDEIKYIEVLPTDYEKYKLVADDVLFTEGGDKDKLGRGTIWKDEILDCIHQNHIFRARIKDKDILLPKYLNYYAQSPHGKDYFYLNAKQTVNLASINKTILSNLPVPLCGRDGQEITVNEIESRLSVADNLEKTIDNSLQKSEALRQSILKRAFEGKLIE